MAGLYQPGMVYIYRFGLLLLPLRKKLKFFEPPWGHWLPGIGPSLDSRLYGHRGSGIQVRYRMGVCLDEFAAWFNLAAHQLGKDLIGEHCIAQGDL